uniref:C-type lectin domain-containing protein n=1 Tax=Wuchereria bancrofti TaxID=6293 RepID=A0A1I8ENZ9_WUCBA
MKRIGLDVYCFRMHSFNRFDKEYIDEFFNRPDGKGDNRMCEEFTLPASPNGTTITIRNKKEYEFVKVLYRTADYSLTSMPLLIGLKYYDERFEWSDKSVFNYAGFMETDFKSRFTYLKKGQCRHGARKYLVFDIDCKIRFLEFRALCRYKVPRSELYVKPVPQPDDYSKTEVKIVLSGKQL